MSSESATKSCTKCLKTLALAEFYKGKSICKDCILSRNTGIRSINDEMLYQAAWNLSEKLCKKCLQTKKRHEFQRDRSQLDGCTKVCRECGRKCRVRGARSSRWSELKSSARRRGIDLALSEITYRKLTECACCHYCRGKLPEYGHGIDRIDNSKGYELGNVVPCCTVCNRIRGDNLTYQQMLKLSPFLREFRMERECCLLDSVTQCHDNAPPANDYEGRHDYAND